MTFVRQKFQKSKINDIKATVRAAISQLPLHIKPGDSVAITAGSRGISKIDMVTLSCIEYLSGIGLKPFIIPSMGSHGGATASGQLDILEKLGISEPSMSVPIRSEMDVTCVGELSCGMKVLLSTPAIKADHIVVINRIKPHTKFMADIESGLCKMMSVGLGKAEGAALFHRAAVKHSFGIIEEAATLIIDKCNVLFGIALIEDVCGNLSHIEAISPELIIKREKALFKKASDNMGRIPFDSIDLLIVDVIGKNISGIGMDSNVTGRHRDITGDFKIPPKVDRIFVRDLAPGSDGNANGIGLADFTTQRLVDAIDMKKTYINAVTAISPEKAAIPIHFDRDVDAIDACAKTLGLESLQQARIVRIKNTSSLEVLQVSKHFESEISGNNNLEIISPWQPLDFDEKGNISPAMP
ncbi:MAG: DUF362 domain-containing protein [Deltaproteobacteria bacterium]|nr:DUF362 domain-containing protein [Deltaproteobacteria bacterium]MBW2218383.1 DUF362 domain-containing protein [Deltaproteobacteria bacterium]